MTYVVGNENKFDVNLPASLSDLNQMFLYVTPFLLSTSLASAISPLLPSSVKELTPTTWPPFLASSLFRSSRSPNSPTHGLQVVNQKFMTVTLFLENSSSLFTSLPSRSLPVKLGNFVASLEALAPAVMPAVEASTLSPALGVLPQPGNSFSRLSSLSSISLICCAPALSVLSSSAVNSSLAPSMVLSKKSP